jgi:hypothetical protein
LVGTLRRPVRTLTRARGEWLDWLMAGGPWVARGQRWRVRGRADGASDVIGCPVASVAGGEGD